MTIYGTWKGFVNSDFSFVDSYESFGNNCINPVKGIVESGQYLEYLGGNTASDYVMPEGWANN